MRLRLDEIGYRGAELLDRLMAGEEKPARPILVSPGGVAERASTRTIPVRHPLLRRALGVMRERMGARLRTGEVAAICGVSRRRLEQLFVAELGRAPHAQLLRMRLQEAERRLRSEAMPVAEVAAACGFAGAGHLRAVFSRAHGEGPRSWRLARRGVLGGPVPPPAADPNGRVSVKTAPRRAGRRCSRG